MWPPRRALRSSSDYACLRPKAGRSLKYLKKSISENSDAAGIPFSLLSKDYPINLSFFAQVCFAQCSSLGSVRGVSEGSGLDTCNANKDTHKCMFLIMSCDGEPWPGSYFHSAIIRMHARGYLRYLKISQHENSIRRINICYVAVHIYPIYVNNPCIERLPIPNAIHYTFCSKIIM